jgi:hypothetical protein
MDSYQAVKEKHRRIVDAGFDAPAPAILQRGGGKTFGFYAKPHGVMVEVCGTSRGSGSERFDSRRLHNYLMYYQYVTDIYILISHNSILRRRILRRASLTVFLLPIKNQSNDRLFLAGIAGKKWMVGFRTAILGQDLFISSCLPTIQELSHCGSDRDAESRHYRSERSRHGHIACVSGV